MSDPYGGGYSGGGLPPASPTQSSERSVKSCYAVVYNLVNRKWVVAGDGGWSEVHLCQDSTDNTHRLLAWTVNSQDVLMNANVTAECTYKEKSKNFHSFQDENQQRYGLGFHKSDSGLRQAENFVTAVRDVIDHCKKVASFRLPPMDPPSAPMGVGVERSASPASQSQPGGAPPPNPYQSTGPQQSGASQAPNKPLPPQPRQPPPNPSQGQRPGQGLPQYQAPEETQKPQHPPPAPHKKPPVPPGKGLPRPAEQANGYGAGGGLPKQEPTYVGLKSGNSGLPKTNYDDEKAPSSPQSRGHGYSIAANAALPKYHLRTETARTVPEGAPALGVLAIHPPKVAKTENTDASISDVQSVERTLQVTYDKDEGVFHGLPKEWQSVLNKQFGVPPHQLPGVKLPQYPSRVPKVLVTLKNGLIQLDGYNQVGVFRLAPNAQDNKEIKSRIDGGQFEFTEGDVNVYANLIKVWFRDLPTPLLHCVEPERIEIAHTEADMIKIVSTMPEPQKSIYLWLCDMCVECAKFQKINKMGPKNLAIVIGPNLFNTNEFENPMKAMTYSQKVVEFFEKSIFWRQSTT